VSNRVTDITATIGTGSALAMLPWRDVCSDVQLLAGTGAAVVGLVAACFSLYRRVRAVRRLSRTRRRQKDEG